jgi:hypothetical protein
MAYPSAQPIGDVAVLMNNHCDNRCPGCIARIPTEGERKMDISMETLKSVVRFAEDCADVRDYKAQLTGFGEPTLNPFLMDAVGLFANSHKPPKQITLLTNGREFSKAETAISFLGRLGAAASGTPVLVCMSADEYHARSVGIKAVAARARNLAAHAEENRINYEFRAGVPQHLLADAKSEKKVTKGIRKRFSLPDGGRVSLLTWTSEESQRHPARHYPVRLVYIDYRGDVRAHFASFVKREPPAGNVNVNTPEEIMKVIRDDEERVNAMPASEAFRN